MAEFADFLSGGVVASPGGGAQPIVRRAVQGFSMTCQEEDNWCWAAVAQAVETLSGARPTQATIASDHVSPGSQTPACTRPLPTGALAKCIACSSGCDSPHSLSAILSERERLAEDGAKFGVPKFEQIKERIDAGKPLPVRIYWGDDQAHFVCVAGYVIRDGTEWVTVYDPKQPGIAMGAAEAQDMRYEIFATEYPSGEQVTGVPDYYYEVK